MNARLFSSQSGFPLRMLKFRQSGKAVEGVIEFVGEKA
jgi:hypothetical protein